MDGRSPPEGKGKGEDKGGHCITDPHSTMWNSLPFALRGSSLSPNTLALPNSGVIRTGALRFLTGCRERRLNRVFFVSATASF